MNHKAAIFAASLCLLFGIAVRLMPHMPNATPITAIAFASSMYLGKRYAIFLPLLALFLSDLFIGFYDWRIMASVYGSFALIGFLALLRRKFSAVFGGIFPTFTLVVFSSLLFFFITNGAVWLFSPWYEKSLSGLLYAYELGIPFLRNMFVGDLVYTVFLIMALELVRQRRGILERLLGKSYVSVRVSRLVNFDKINS